MQLYIILYLKKYLFILYLKNYVFKLQLRNATLQNTILNIQFIFLNSIVQYLNMP